MPAVPSRGRGRARRPMFVARRRRRALPGLLLGTGMLAGLWLAAGGPLGGLDRAVGSLGDPPADSQQAVGADRSAPQAGDDPGPAADGVAHQTRDRPDAATPRFASVGGLDLHLPTPSPVVVGFHEASTTGARELAPVGVVTENENTTKFDPPDAAGDGTDYLVLSSRGRVHAATSAVDVMMRDGDPVRSPVHGTVTDVRTYHLYGSYEDRRLEITPTGHPRLRVVLIHLDEVEVAVGDVVTAGETVLAGTARPFPFGSQIDRYTEPDRWPHVHIEVKHEDDAGPGDAGQSVAGHGDDAGTEDDAQSMEASR